MNGSREVFVHSIATAVPQYSVSQEDAFAFAVRNTQDGEERAGFLKRIYRGSAIRRRHSVVADYVRKLQEFTFLSRSPDWRSSPSTTQRNAVYVREAETLAMQVVEALFAESSSEFSGRVGASRIAPAAITHLITVSCTGFSAPGFDLAIQKKLLSNRVHRTHIGFMGCYATLPALKLAHSICSADRKARVLIVSVELCSLHFQRKWEPDLAVANALFADGAGALVISADRDDCCESPPLYSLLDFESRVLVDTDDAMAWTIGETGFEMKLSSYVPAAISTTIGPLVDELLDRNGVGRKDVSHWAIHPGGKAILEHAGIGLQLDRTALASSYDVLEAFGNMSSATICFVLADIATRSPSEHVFAAAFGPGLTIESALLRGIAQ